MQEEISALNLNHTWDVIDPPQNARIVGCKWHYKLKFNSDGTLERHKARLVAKGFTQTKGIDYEETFAPVAKMTSIRILLSIACNLDWPLFQLDVKNAFLQGDLDEDIYMSLPLGHPLEGYGKVCHLKKVIYGLKQSPRAWYFKLSHALEQIGFKKCYTDYSLFVK
ncbi:reverse transcriptase domain-containing protein, partial [Klebsiella pneumoniae]|uniref:reverse transcriptase domain-containing protein n=1 Tax=Klebsiella pneumoniae TaxID=573 RepID=UPI003A811871